MKFDAQDITIMDSLNRAEAIAYIKFLKSERRRHEKDIWAIDDKIKEIRRRFNLDELL